MPLNTTKSSEYATLLFHRNFNIQQSVIEASYNADLQRQKYTPPTISEDTLLSKQTANLKRTITSDNDAKMPSLDVTLAYALPIRTDALAARIQTHIETIPTIHTLRLCNRFGHGRFTDFPVELVKMIERYYVEPVHQKVADDLYKASGCFRNECSLSHHAEREVLLRLYREGMRASPLDHFPDEPDDWQLERFLYKYCDPTYNPAIDEPGVHQHKRALWPPKIKSIFSKANRAMFLDRFGLDIWFSFVCLADNGTYEEEFGLPQATITYLTLPGSITRKHKWEANCHYRDANGNKVTIPSSYGENGLGMTMEACKQPSAEELSRFTRVLKTLDLRVSVQRGQKQCLALRPLSSAEDGDSDGSTGHSGSASSPCDEYCDCMDSPVRVSPFDEKDQDSKFPRLMFLTRNKDIRQA